MTAGKPLASIRVIDLTRVLAGPYCTMILGNLGAEIIKIEAPEGDDSRRFGPFLDGNTEKSAYFCSINCGKKSVSLDLKREEGKQILADLLRISQVLIDNFRPGTLAKLGFNDDRIKELNPEIIYATASGFGYSGPDQGKAAYDSIIQALSGIISITGTESGETVRVGTSISDIVTGCFTAIGIVSALYRHEKTSVGARIDVAMLDSTVAVLENAIARYQATGEAPKPLGSRHPSIAPFETFETQDAPIMISAGNDKLFAGLCEVIGHKELARDPRFADNLSRTENREALRNIINSALRMETAATWLRQLDRANIPCAKINTIEDLFRSEQLNARHMLIPIDGQDGFKIAGNPIKFSDLPIATQAERPPALGEHTREILTGMLGYSPDHVQQLYVKNVLR
ncbi:MAG: CoA transferase [Deltaproteobacteria bacterium]|nr:CoA transferase [Deltaproteobacteria bacterium]